MPTRRTPRALPANGGVMYTFDLVLFCLSVALYTAYNLYIRHKESVDPGFTIHGISRTARIQWVASVLEQKNGILAVQTLRNATMASTFMASTSVLLAVGVLSLTGNGENVRHTWHSLNFFLAFFCFTSSLRLYTHVAFMLGAEREPEDQSRISCMAEKYLNMGADHFSLGMRAFYFTVPLVFWIFGAQFMLFGTAFLISIVYTLDKTPKQTNQE